MEEKTSVKPMLKQPRGFGKVWYILYPILIYFGVMIFTSLVATIALSVSLAMQNPFAGGDMVAYSTELGTKVSEMVSAYTVHIQTISYFLLAGIFLLLFIRDIKRRGLYRDRAEKAGVLPYIFMVLTVGGYSMFFVTLVSITRLYENFPVMLDNAAVFEGQSPILIFILISVITPICEELFFRGMLFKRLRGMISFVPAAIISSVIFGLAHVSVPQIIYTSILAFLFAYIYEKYGSILVPIFCHFTLNTIMFLLDYVLPDFMATETAVIITFVVSGVVFITGLIPLLISLKKMPPVLHKMPEYQPPEIAPPAPSYIPPTENV